MPLAASGTIHQAWGFGFRLRLGFAERRQDAPVQALTLGYPFLSTMHLR